MGDYTTVARKGDLPPDSGKVVEAGGKQIALFNVDGTYYAVDNTCLHRGGPIGEGELSGCVVTCPWHGWQYDVRSGKNEMNPSIGLASYKVQVVGDDVQVEL